MGCFKEMITEKSSFETNVNLFLTDPDDFVIANLCDEEVSPLQFQFATLDLKPSSYLQRNTLKENKWQPFQVNACDLLG